MTAPLPLVSALVPTYNGARFIEKTLSALAAQTWPNLEIVIADDASTDDTLAIVRRFAAGRQNVRVIARDRNLGWLDNANRLMGEAKGELLFFAFHDDIPEPTYVERLAHRLGEDPTAILAFSDFALHHVDGTVKLIAFRDLDHRRTPLRRALRMARRPPKWFAPNRGLFRAEAYARTGGMKRSPVGEFSADWLWLLELCTHGNFVRVPEVLLRKYYQDTSLSRSWEYNEEKFTVLRRFAAGVIAAGDQPWFLRLVLSLRLRFLRQRRRR